MAKTKRNKQNKQNLSTTQNSQKRKLNKRKSAEKLQGTGIGRIEVYQKFFDWQVNTSNAEERKPMKIPAPLFILDSKAATWSDLVKTPQSQWVFIRSNIHQILLKPDLQAYGRKPGAKSRGVKSPFTIIKELINAQDDCFHTANLPPNWRNNLRSFEKSFLGRIIKAGLVDNKKAPALPLAKLVGDVYSQMHPQLKDATAHDINKAHYVPRKVTKRPQHFGIRLMTTLPHVETRNLSSDLPSQMLLSQPKPKSSQR
ncbi:uncharacterized protein VP01_525g6 [Puccinia sorghi]|uniref:Uncharacterized protein n=1 Tax=Puccinia sorghi TaxID=27349 RepID=A0A0L6UKF4_9BASI|nr:uncharacterized protein VP01_525g6 [Puccinia sorghi]